jgi:uncharacterized protein (TIGR03086 family)
MEAYAALTTATEAFRVRLDRVTDDQLDLPTPCDGWAVRDLLSHVTAGDRMAVALMEGCSVDEARGFFARSAAPDDVRAACAASLEAQMKALGPGLDTTMVVHHPMGDMPAGQVFGFRIGDLLLHSWDLSSAVGGDERLPADVVAHVYSELEPMAPVIASIGVFGSGPSGTVSEEADTQTRLLDLTGRRPS